MWLQKWFPDGDGHDKIPPDNEGQVVVLNQMKPGKSSYCNEQM